MLERLIEIISPGWAVQRCLDRAVLGNYKATHPDGVSAGRLDKPHGRNSLIIGGSLTDQQKTASMRQRAIKVDDENPVGSGILNRMTDNVIGCGFTLQAMTDSVDFNKEAQERYTEWYDKADVRKLLSGAELDRLTYRSYEREGDVGKILVDRGGESRLQFIEADMIVTPHDYRGKNRIVDGVEIDSVCAPVAFHILNVDETGARKFTRVLAENFVFLPRIKRGSTQIRGKSGFATIFGLLDQLDGYVDAVIVAARMAAIFGLIFKEPNAAKTYNGLQSINPSQGTKQKVLTLDRGMVRYVGNEGDVVQVDAKQPMNQTPEFIEAMLRLIGLPFDMPLELVQLNFSKTNLSSARIAMQSFHRSCQAKQDLFIQRDKSRVYQWWLSREVRRGTFITRAPAKFWTHAFHPDSWQRVDPITDLQEILLEVSMGLNSLRRAGASMGRDFVTLVNELGEDRVKLTDANIPTILSNFTRDPGANLPTPPGNNNGQEADKADAGK